MKRIPSIILLLIASLFLPGIVSAADVVMYTASTSSLTYSNFNWNATPDNYAWSFQLQNIGVPKTFKIYNDNSASAQAQFCLKADKTSASASYGCTATSTLVAGLNTLSLSATSTMLSTSTVFWVYMGVNTATPRINYVYPGSNNAIWRSSASAIDPDTSWFSADIAMEIIGDPYVPPTPSSSSTQFLVIPSSNPVFPLTVVLLIVVIYLWISRR